MFVLEPGPIDERAHRAAGWLRSRGLRAGDRVAVCASNHPGYVPMTMGALRTGIVPVLVNAHLGADERSRILADCDASVVLTDEAWPDVSDAEPVEMGPYPLARPMHYTSGTTGTSKGVWSGLLSEQEAEDLVADERDLWDARPKDTFLVVSPLYHSAPHRSALSALLAGARVIVFERFDVPRVTDVLAREAVTGAFMVPTHLRRLLAHGFEAPAARRILHAGEPCPPELKRRAMDAFGDEVLWEFYGSTEGQFTALPPDEWAEHPDSVGRARAGRTLTIEDPGPDGVGRIWVTAPACWRWRYWNDPQKTADAWRGDAFTVGDLGRIDDDGYLHLVGRRDDLVISGGVNVYPAEVEKVLAEHPDVIEAGVFGRPDPEWGQRVCVALVVGPDAPSAVAERVVDWARDRLPASHVPKDVYVVDALPRTQTGKVRRIDLAEWLGG